jgi:hypothetical protein
MVTAARPDGTTIVPADPSSASMAWARASVVGVPRVP